MKRTPWFPVGKDHRTSDEKRNATHCLRGHEFTPENTLVRKNGTRRCKACARIYVQAHPRPPKKRPAVEKTPRMHEKKPNVDLTGMRFGRLTAGEYVPGSRWRCICECGQIVVTTTNKLTSGHSKSCGCLVRKHGMHGTRVYRIWRGMTDRCLNPSSKDWGNYGGRGISICDGWRVFENFFRDMGHPPSDGHSIDRIDVNGNYEPGNCRWATAEVQARNQRRAMPNGEVVAAEARRRLDLKERAVDVAAALGIPVSFVYNVKYKPDLWRGLTQPAE